MYAIAKRSMRWTRYTSGKKKKEIERGIPEKNRKGKKQGFYIRAKREHRVPGEGKYRSTAATTTAIRLAAVSSHVRMRKRP